MKKIELISYRDKYKGLFAIVDDEDFYVLKNMKVNLLVQIIL